MARDATLRVITKLEGGDDFQKRLKDISTASYDNKKNFDLAKASAESMGDKLGALKAQQDYYTKSVELQNQKLQVYKEALLQAQAAGHGNTETTTALSNSVRNSEIEVKKMETNLRKTNEALYDTAVAEGKTSKEAEAMGGQMKKAGSNTEGFTGQFKDLVKNTLASYATFAGAIALFEKFGKASFDAIKGAAQFGDETETMGRKLGISTDQIQKLSYAEAFVDVDLNTMAGSMAKLTKSVVGAQTGNQVLIKSFQDLGVEFEDKNKKALDSYDTFSNVIDALASMGNEQDQERLSMQLFGRSWQDLNPLVRSGSGALKKYGDEAESMGVILDQVTIKQLSLLQDQLDRTSKSTEAATNKTAVNAASTVNALAKLWNSIVKGSNEATDGIARASVKSKILASDYPEWVKQVMTANIDLSISAQETSQILGWSADEYKSKLIELENYYMSKGLTATEAYIESLKQVANGFDLEQVKADEVKTKLDELDAAVNSSTKELVDAQTQYATAVESRTAEILDSLGGLFGAFPAKMDLSKKELKHLADGMVEDLNGQVAGLQKWSDGLKELSNKGVEQGLIDELRKAGPGAAAQVEALNSMTGLELNNYVDLWYQKSALARDQAVSEMEPLKDQITEKIKALEDAINDRDTYAREAGAKLGQNIADGITSKTSAISKAAQEAVKKALNDARQLVGLPKVDYNTSSNGPNLTDNGFPSSVPHDANGEIFGYNPHIAVVADNPNGETMVPHDRTPQAQSLAMNAVKETGLKMGGFHQTLNITVHENDPNRIAQVIKDASYAMYLGYINL